VIAIDGPSGVGKSTVARLLAERLGLAYLDSGALYRAVALKVLRAGVDPDDPAAVEGLLEHSRVEIELEPGATIVVRLDGVAVSEELREAAVARVASRIAAQPAVRRLLTALQRAAVPAAGAVVEGRDIGSVVFPDAKLKLFVTASPRVRAERRVGEIGGKVEDIEAAIIARDRKDSTRAHSPLTEADDAVVVDTTGMTVEQVVEHILSLIL
jgi:cytidylate kinase